MLQLEKSIGSGDMVVSSSDSDSDNSDAELDVAIRYNGIYYADF